MSYDVLPGQVCCSGCFCPVDSRGHDAIDVLCCGSPWLLEEGGGGAGTPIHSREVACGLALGIHSHCSSKHCFWPFTGRRGEGLA